MHISTPFGFCECVIYLLWVVTALSDDKNPTVKDMVQALSSNKEAYTAMAPALAKLVKMSVVSDSVNALGLTGAMAKQAVMSEIQMTPVVKAARSALDVLAKSITVNPMTSLTKTAQQLSSVLAAQVTGVDASVLLSAFSDRLAELRRIPFDADMETESIPDIIPVAEAEIRQIVQEKPVDGVARIQGWISIFLALMGLLLTYIGMQPNAQDEARNQLLERQAEAWERIAQAEEDRAAAELRQADNLEKQAAISYELIEVLKMNYEMFVSLADADELPPQASEADDAGTGSGNSEE